MIKLHDALDICLIVPLSGSSRKMEVCSALYKMKLQQTQKRNTPPSSYVPATEP